MRVSLLTAIGSMALAIPAFADQEYTSQVVDDVPTAYTENTMLDVDNEPDLGLLAPSDWKSDDISFDAAHAAMGEKAPTFTINTGKYIVEIDADGEVLSRTPVGQSTLGKASGLGDKTVMAAMFGYGVPEVGRLQQVALKAQQACLLVSAEKVEEARLMDKVVEFTGLSGGYHYMSLEDPEVTSFLIQAKGVEPVNLSAAYADFVATATANSKAQELKEQLEWQRTIRSDNWDPEVGPAENMGRIAGPYVASAAYNAGIYGVGNAYGWGYAAAAGTGTVGVHVDDIGVEAGSIYGRYIDHTGSNMFVPSGGMSKSPYPDRSVLDSIREAFDKVFSNKE